MKRLAALAAMAVVLVMVGCVTEDTEDPVVSIKSPANGATLAPGNITIKAYATDNKEVTKVEFYAGTTLIGTDESGNSDTFDVSWTATAGSYTLKATAFDAADNSADATVNVTIAAGGAGPTVAIVYPIDGSTIGAGPATIKATAVDTRGVAKVEFFDGSTAVGVDTVAVADTFSVSWTATAGLHTLRAIATNDSGATGSDTISVTVTAGGGPTHHAGEIPADEVWYPSGNPHIIDENVYTGDGVTLTIKPGCYVQFSAGTELYTGYASPGSIIAAGTADSAITFTSLSDTVPGFWDGIVFYSQTISTARMSYCKVEFGGNSSASRDGAVAIDNTSIKFDHNTVRKSGRNGVWVSVDGYFTEFTNNTITSCTKYAVHVGANHVGTLGTGNILTGNTKNGIEVDGTEIDADATWLDHGVPYVLTDDAYVTSSATLTISAGCTIGLNTGVDLYCGYSEPGSIIAIGTAESPITFTTFVDTVAGIWDGITFYSQTISTARLSYVTVEYAGNTGASRDGAVSVDNCRIKMDHCTLRDNGQYGVFAVTSGYFDDFSNNAITTSGEYPVKIDANEAWTLGTGNVLTGNTKDGIMIEGENIESSGTWLNHGVPYVISDDVYISDATNSPVLTIAAGTTIKLNTGVEFYVGYAAAGGLICDGTAGEITFTSVINPPSAGDWDRLSFYSQSINSQCKLINCRVEYGGGDDYGNIYISDCTPTVTGCNIGHGAAYGIYLTGSEYPDPATLRANNTFYDNASGDIREP